MKEKKELPVGQKVRGYGLLNEYGEFEFYPEQTGARKGRIKVIKQTADYTLSTSSGHVIVHCKVQKTSTLAIVKDLMSIMSNIINDLKTYAI